MFAGLIGLNISGNRTAPLSELEGKEGPKEGDEGEPKGRKRGAEGESGERG